MKPEEKSDRVMGHVESLLCLSFKYGPKKMICFSKKPMQQMSYWNLKPNEWHIPIESLNALFSNLFGSPIEKGRTTQTNFVLAIGTWDWSPDQLTSWWCPISTNFYSPLLDQELLSSSFFNECVNSIHLQICHKKKGIRLSWTHFVIGLIISTKSNPNWSIRLVGFNYTIQSNTLRYIEQIGPLGLIGSIISRTFTCSGLNLHTGCFRLKTTKGTLIIRTITHNNI